MIRKSDRGERAFMKVVSIFRRTPEAPLPEKRASDQALEAVARLAGGVAHELNNILLVVQGYLDMALQEDDAGPETRRQLEEVRAAAVRAARLVGDLLVVGQRGPVSPQPVDLNALLSRLAPEWTRITGEGVRVRLALAEGLPPILADEQHLATLCAVFCGRAREVMPSGGTLTFVTRAAQSGGERRAILEVTDDGIPEPPEIRARVFEPYLPGRAGGKALGLGLSLAYGIVKRVGGEMRAEFPEVGGARFLVSIPVCEQPLAQRGAPPTLTPPALAAAETRSARAAEGEGPVNARADGQRPGDGLSILLAEDDEGLRTLATRILIREGYVVLAARDGQEALELFERNKATVSLALLDDVMPRMGGRAALLRMRSVAPDLPAILCTGYTWSLDGKAQDAGEGFEVLPKPWRPRELLRMVREELEPRRA